MNILYPLHFTGFEVLFGEDKREAETAGKEMIRKILYLEILTKPDLLT